MRVMWSRKVGLRARSLNRGLLRLVMVAKKIREVPGLTGTAYTIMLNLVRPSGLMPPRRYCKRLGGWKMMSWMVEALHQVSTAEDLPLH